VVLVVATIGSSLSFVLETERNAKICGQNDNILVSVSWGILYRMMEVCDADGIGGCQKDSFV